MKNRPPAHANIPYGQTSKPIFLRIAIALFFLALAASPTSAPAAAAPILSSPTHPDPQLQYKARDIQFTWAPPPGAEPISRYYHQFDQLPATIPSAAHASTTNTHISFFDIDIGRRYFHLRAQDAATGALSDTAHFQVQIVPNDLKITNVSQSWSSPYLLDFDFSLRDADDHAVIVPAETLSYTCREGGQPVSPSETATYLIQGANKVISCYLVLDYTNSMASIAANGDSDGDGISDAIETMELAAKAFVDSLSTATRVGVWEFHREDVDPALVSDLTNNKEYVKERIDAIWDEYVQNFPASSRCWDAAYAAVAAFPEQKSRDEQRFTVFLSDGRDESSAHNANDIIGVAQARGVKVYAIGFGAELDATALTEIASEAGGQYYAAANVEGLTEAFFEIGRDLQGQYILRWATLKRYSGDAFKPSFTITLGESDTYNAIGRYNPAENQGNILQGQLRFVGSPAVGEETDVYLRAAYTPRYITRLRLYIATPYAYDLAIVSSNDGGLCDGWTLTAAAIPEHPGAQWIELASPDPGDINTAIPYAAFGNLLQFHFTGLADLELLTDRYNLNAFADNTIYGSGQRLDIEFLTSLARDPGAPQEPEDYEIVFKNCRLTVAPGPRLGVWAHIGEKSTVKIRKKKLPKNITLNGDGIATTTAGVAYIRTMLVAAIDAEGDFEKFYSEAPIKTLRVTDGSIESLTSEGRHIERLRATGLSRLRMSAAHNSTESDHAPVASAYIETDTFLNLKARVALTGIVLRDLLAPRQEFSNITAATKKYNVPGSKTKANFLSYAGLEGGQVEVLQLRKLRSTGGPISPMVLAAGEKLPQTSISQKSLKITAKGAIFSVGPTKKERAPWPRQADVAPGALYADASRLTIKTKGGHLAPVVLFATRNIALLQCDWIEYRDGQNNIRFGGILLAPVVCSGGAESRKSTIGKIHGARWVEGDFYAGVAPASLATIAGGGYLPTPTYDGSIQNIITTKNSRKWPNDPEPLIEGRGFVRDYGKLRRKLDKQGNAAGFTLHDVTHPK